MFSLQLVDIDGNLVIEVWFEIKLFEKFWTKFEENERYTLLYLYRVQS